MASRSDRTPALEWLCAGGLLLFGASVLAHWVPPDDPRLALCVVRRVFHIACPGCGLTRSFADLAKGNFIGAFARHPVGPVLALEGILLWAAWGVSLAVTSRSVGVAYRSLNQLLAADAVALIIVWLIRLSTGTLPS